jgi:lipopolysaccharide transport system permease protein
VVRRNLGLLESAKALSRKIRRASFWLPISAPWQTKLSLLKALVQRDLEARYKGSMLGNLWPLLNQLSQLLIYTYVFSIVLKVKLELKGLPATDLTFGLWLYAGLLPWIAFSTGLMQAAVTVVQQPNLIKRVVFPLTLLPLVPVISAFVESSVGFMALLVLLTFTTKTLHATLWLMPFIWLPQLLLTAGLSYLMAGFTVFLRDTPQTLAVIVNLWFYLTPIVYPASIIPQQWQQWIFWINPMAAIAEIYRDLILTGEVLHRGEWMIVAIVSLIIFYLGLKSYRRLCPAFADVI